MKNLISIITALFYSVSLYCANVVPQETPVKFEIHYSEKGVKAKISLKDGAYKRTLLFT